jgi:hypothetical protein
VSVCLVSYMPIALDYLTELRVIDCPRAYALQE